MSKIRNTTTAEPVREVSLLGMCVGTDAIEIQERRGAAEMASQDEQLPVKGSDDPVWAKIGVLFGDPVEGDRLFRKVKLPLGWKIVRTDHNMWTKLVDERGRTRAEIFYKAAFYDRDAHIRPCRRFSVMSEYVYPEANDDEYVESVGERVVVKDSGVVLYATATLPRLGRGVGPEVWKKRDEDKERLAAEAAAWLADKGFPDWKDNAAYWD